MGKNLFACLVVLVICVSGLPNDWSKRTILERDASLMTPNDWEEIEIPEPTELVELVFALKHQNIDQLEVYLEGMLYSLEVN